MQDIDKLIQELRELSTSYYVPSVPRESAEILRLISFIYSLGQDYVVAVEVGTGVGYSTA
ncbi:MAG: hypothetical protein ACP6IS_08500 [Candidatus Asgardarchaeia archaeon]